MRVMLAMQAVVIQHLPQRRLIQLVTGPWLPPASHSAAAAVEGVV